VLAFAGVRLRREHALELASMLRAEGHDQTARLLISAITSGQEFVALTDGDRARILAVLDDPPRALVELRAVLFGELNWRREGLAPT
jgi:hypothetical protein